MVRVYVPVDADDVAGLLDGGDVRNEAFWAETEDEQDEFDAFDDACAVGPAVAAADVETAGDVVTLEQVAAFHVDADGSGDFAWYATQEADQVVDLLRSAMS